MGCVSPSALKMSDSWSCLTSRSYDLQITTFLLTRLTIILFYKIVEHTEISARKERDSDQQNNQHQKAAILQRTVRVQQQKN